MSRWLPVYQEYVLEAKASGDSGWWNGYCPFHENPGTSKTPSFGFNAESGGFKCQGCGAAGNAFKFIGMVHGVVGSPDDPDTKLVIEKLIRDKFASVLNGSGPAKPKATKVTKKERLPTDDAIQKWHEQLIASPTVLHQLALRGIGANELIQHRIGYDPARLKITIPIMALGAVANVRFWGYDGRTTPKFQGVKGHNENRIFPEVAMIGEVVWLVEGEPDCLTMRSLGLNAATFTSGANSNPPKQDLPLFKGKGVVICYDLDKAGRDGARRAASALRKYTRRIKVLDLSELSGVKEGADLTDIFREIGPALVDRLDELRKTTTVHEPKVDNKSVISEVAFGDSITSAYIDRPIKIQAMVTGHGERPFSAYRKIKATCLATNSSNPNCIICRLARGDFEEKEVQPRDLLLQVKKTDFQLRKMLTDYVGAECGLWSVVEKESKFESMYEVMIGPSDETVLDSIGSTGLQQRRAWLVRESFPKINQSYTLFGHTVKDPNDQSNTQVFTEVHESVNPVDQFVLTDEIRDVIKGFNP